jgi:uncharacterized delta-60 repeat protein
MKDKFKNKNKNLKILNYLIIAVLMIIFIINVNASNLSGKLDTSFNKTGYVTSYIIEDGGASGGKILIDNENNIIVAGYAWNNRLEHDREQYTVIWKFDSNGNPINSFGNSKGYSIFKLGQNEKGRSIFLRRGFSLTKDDKILMSGIIFEFDENPKDFKKYFGIWKFNPDGSADKSFANNGLSLINLENSEIRSWDIRDSKLDSNEKIVIVGKTFLKNKSYSDILAVRFNPDGSLDKTFNNQGYITLNASPEFDYDDSAKAVAIDNKNNRIYITGYSRQIKGNDMARWCLKSDGTLDKTFGNNGIVIHNNAAGGNWNDESQSIIVDTKGRILVVGRSKSNRGDYDIVIWRYNPDGSLDKTFNNQGFVLYDYKSKEDRPTSIILDKQGRILVAGYVNNGRDDDVIVLRYKENGVLDESFADNGVFVYHNIAGGDWDDRAYSLALDKFGKIYITGSSDYGGDNDMFILKINP